MPRPEIQHHIPPGPHRVLDVGCGEGIFGESIKQLGKAEEVVGIELDQYAAEAARSRLDRVICGDLETFDWDGLGLAKGAFDYVVCGDVLEHLKDPWDALRRLSTLLKENGRLIASIPNVRHWSVTLPLLFLGAWNYAPRGILDRTHLRFFTRRTACRMFMEAGLQIERCDGLRFSKKDRVIHLLLLGLGPEWSSPQWLLIGYPETQSVQK
ncbi:methyltransferase domain-containing protein [Methylococcus geothermalis]|uniref:Methyltransferase domain-containing protein n=2 Tax=Methylococcus geothermalis TaxID=2681310 RepID=A0A858QCA4_9GAMM|nr:methyltransferase domain-containing protein [Methylococcus geothermalis]